MEKNERKIKKNLSSVIFSHVYLVGSHSFVSLKTIKSSSKAAFRYRVFYEHQHQLYFNFSSMSLIWRFFFIKVGISFSFEVGTSVIPFFVVVKFD